MATHSENIHTQNINEQNSKLKEAIGVAYTKAPEPVPALETIDTPSWSTSLRCDPRNIALPVAGCSMIFKVLLNKSLGALGRPGSDKVVSTTGGRELGVTVSGVQVQCRVDHGTAPFSDNRCSGPRSVTFCQLSEATKDWGSSTP